MEHILFAQFFDRGKDSDQPNTKDPCRFDVRCRLIPGGRITSVPPKLVEAGV